MSTLIKKNFTLTTKQFKGKKLLFEADKTKVHHNPQFESSSLNDMKIGIEGTSIDNTWNASITHDEVVEVNGVYVDRVDIYEEGILRALNDEDKQKLHGFIREAIG